MEYKILKDIENKGEKYVFEEFKKDLDYYISTLDYLEKRIRDLVKELEIMSQKKDINLDVMLRIIQCYKIVYDEYLEKFNNFSIPNFINSITTNTKEEV